MSDEHEPEPEDKPETDVEIADDDPIRALVRAAGRQEPAPGASILPGVQKKLRERSRGKFYGDGWSTAQQTTSYLLVALLMLVVLGAAYYALGPMGIGH
jgi:hypothetical protein